MVDVSVIVDVVPVFHVRLVKVSLTLSLGGNFLYF